MVPVRTYVAMILQKTGGGDGLRFNALVFSIVFFH